MRSLARLHASPTLAQELPQILKAISDKKLRTMQRALARVWTR